MDAVARKTTRTERPRWRGSHALNRLSRDVLARAGRRRGFVHAEVLTQWQAIVGPELARFCCPEKIAGHGAPRWGGATLRVRVDGGIAVELQHLEPQIVERINTYFGYAAVARLSFIQGPLPPAEAPRPRPRALSGTELKAIEARIRGTADARLSASLAALGRQIAAQHDA